MLLICQEVVNDIKNGTGGLHGSIIKEIVTTASQFVSCSCIFDSRTFNLEAHGLAKYALSLI